MPRYRSPEELKAIHAKRYGGYSVTYHELNLQEIVGKKPKPENVHSKTSNWKYYTTSKNLRLFSRVGMFAARIMFPFAEDSLLIGKAFVESFEDSMKEYTETKNVDEAVISGIKSFVKNYTLNKAETIINSEFEASLKGTISMSTAYAISNSLELADIAQNINTNMTN